ncbi:hypothetical protein EPA93_27005 [Ktedonosporobacter rubrisoli]|uniref:Uncharacterized protein n=1 Tax=Ktedonosporobacter rubrisoli TaxID=2509675 RepID=A0A4P6JWP3_KTERU|nr:hypothetical protein [Ktedonosporobacter rubrisoli]QBD79436.1 hypothetical protein EPA93_27005 [Ktedonosporobacter rubrisoli]
MWRVTIAMALGLIPRAASVTVDNWGAFLGNLAWLPWGLALAGATLAYSHRRRGRCHRCDQQ